MKYTFKNPTVNDILKIKDIIYSSNNRYVIKEYNYKNELTGVIKLVNLKTTEVAVVFAPDDYMELKIFLKRVNRIDSENPKFDEIFKSDYSPKIIKKRINTTTVTIKPKEQTLILLTDQDYENYNLENDPDTKQI